MSSELYTGSNSPKEEEEVKKDVTGLLSPSSSPSSSSHSSTKGSIVENKHGCLEKSRENEFEDNEFQENGFEDNEFQENEDNEYQENEFEDSAMLEDYGDCAAAIFNSKYLYKPLSEIGEGFEEMSECLQYHDLRLRRFSESCSHISRFLDFLGLSFTFADTDYVSKVHDLAEAPKACRTLKSILDYDLKKNTVKTPGNFSHSLWRVRQGLDFIRVLFNLLSTNDDSLKEAALIAYETVCAPYHTSDVKTAVSAGICALPTRYQLLMDLNETCDSAEKEMRRYINAALPIIEYIDKLYISRNINLDW